jgi:hypothetical protein
MPVVDTSTHRLIGSGGSSRRRDGRRGNQDAMRRNFSRLLVAVRQQALAIRPPRPAAAAVHVAVIQAGLLAVTGEADRVVVVVLPAALGVGSRHRRACEGNDDGTKSHENRARHPAGTHRGCRSKGVRDDSDAHWRQR